MHIFIALGIIRLGGHEYSSTICITICYRKHVQKNVREPNIGPAVPSTNTTTIATMSSSLPMRTRVEDYIRQLQDQIVSSLEALDPNAPAFKRDGWLRPDNGGSGLSCVFAVPPSTSAAAPPPTTILEKAGVNISIVHGTLPPAAIKQMRADHSNLPESPETGMPFFAAGISLVIHPRNPHCPTVHANYRYFEVSSSTSSPDNVIAWWFGGGSDLTPSYLYEEDVTHFHKTLLDASPSPSLYQEMKKWCDTYFHIPHRNESRGVGGIFYDDLSLEKHAQLSQDALPKTEEEIFGLMQSFGDAFIPSYLPIVEKRKNTEYTPRERRWQLIRRGRYVEFNLVYDRGTKFGLMTPNARIESILMSLPEEARWEYMSELGEEEGSEERKLVEILKKPRNWV